MEPLVPAKLALFKFHGIPRNSMELLMSAKLAHRKFHGIPWNFKCANFDDMSSSMEFHGMSSAPISLTRAVPWNSMELLVSVPWNSMEPIACYLMEPLVSSIHWVLKWDRIPWNLSFQILMKIIFNCAGWINFRKLIKTIYLFAISFTTDVLSLIFALYHMHFRHYSLRIKISFKISFQCSLKLILIKKFHGTFSRVPWNFLNNMWTTPVVPWNSMEFHGILSRSKVPWNSMELFPYSRVPCNSM